MTTLFNAGRAALLAVTILVPAKGFAQSDGGSAGAAMANKAELEKAQAAGSTADAKKSFPIPKAGGKDNQIQMITGLCGVQMKSMRPESCHCLAEQSLTGLSDPQRDYLIATVVSPPAADRMLADGRVGQPDQKVIAAFIDKTSDACATGKFVAPAK